MNNLEIAQSAKLQPISQVAASAGLQPEEFDLIGSTKAKLKLDAAHKRASSSRQGKLVLVTAITPTPAGEGKTTVSIGLAQGLCRIGKRAIPALREPALGPLFGVKGGACGGGYSQVLPMEEINLFFTGDFPSVSAAHNLLSAMLDSSIHFSNPTQTDLRHIWWPRTVDMIDRALRETVVGLGEGNGNVRSDRTVITPASEVMAILCLATSIADLKERLSRIVVARTGGGVPVTAGDLGATGAMAVLLRDALRPNLVQTMEGGLAIIHGGPFGNVAHGCSSILGIQSGLGIGDYVVTEGGFGSDLGGEKFLNIVVPRLGRQPNAIVLVATVRALRHHGNGDLSAGLVNLDRHLDHLTQYGPPVVVAVNRFADDTEADLAEICAAAAARGVMAAVADSWMGGGTGSEPLAKLVDEACQTESSFRSIYDSTDPIVEKMTKIVKQVYGGASVSLGKVAERQLKWLDAHGFGQFPVCMAKTQMSFSEDPTLVGAPRGFDIHVRELRLSAGAGFVVAICGEMMLMPGLGKVPAALRMDVDDDGVIHGLN